MRVLPLVVVLGTFCVGTAPTYAVSAAALAGDATEVIPTGGTPKTSAPESGAMMPEPSQKSTDVPPASPARPIPARPNTPSVH